LERFIVNPGPITMAVGIATISLMRAGTNQGWDESVNWGIY